LTHKIEVDEDIYHQINLVAEAGGWTHSEAICRLAAVKRDRLLKEAEELRPLAEIAPKVTVSRDRAGVTIEVANKPLDVRTTDATPEPEEESIEATATVERARDRFADRPRPEEFGQMCAAGYLKAKQKLHAEMSDGTVYEFIVTSDGGLRHDGTEYATASAALAAAHGSPLNAWDYIKDKKGNSLREILHAFRQDNAMQ
jgi:hypothetical protein